MTVVKPTDKGLRVLGGRFRDYRERQGWSQREAARRITQKIKPGLTASALGRIEDGNLKTIKMETLLMLAQIGYGDMGFSEMVDLATGNRLSACEGSSRYCAVV